MVSTPSWLVSSIVHALLLLVLGLWTIPQASRQVLVTIVAGGAEEEPELPPEDVDILPRQQDHALDDNDLTIDAPLEATPVDLASLADDRESDAAAGETMSTAGHEGGLLAVAPDHGPPAGDAFRGRGDAVRRAALVRSGGGTPASEKAVALALKWLSLHQSSDGGWCFDHSFGTTCAQRCRDAGRARDARRGATALALLPFLGAGHTPQTGQYKDVVHRGVHYLIAQQNTQTGSLFEPAGQMYSHGLAAVALCEAYAMTQDKILRERAQLAIDFIADAQDEVGGGWRYMPKQRGDTSVVGWQVMALKSGSMSYLRVQGETVRGAARFLDNVAFDGGAMYGYQGREKRPATTAIGLLCRMYMGWKPDHPTLQTGVQYLSQLGPSKDDMYYNYYATQVLHHFGREPWRMWNARMREQLVASQETQGHAAGSWRIRDPHGNGPGGRLYATAMATMILEVYYRHLPIYTRQSVDERFLVD